MIKLKDLLPEVSSNTTTYQADGGESDTGYTAVGQDRVLGVDQGKPEPWFLRGGYSQLSYPTADDPYGGEKEKKYNRYRLSKKLLTQMKNTKPLTQIPQVGKNTEIKIIRQIFLRMILITYND